MTTIAWDGKTLCADRQATNSGLARACTKLFRSGDCVIAVCGQLVYGLELKAWYESGANPDKFPAAQREDNKWGPMMVWKADGMWRYEQSPYPMKIESPPYACGSGRDFAMMAMHLGNSAERAVELASLFDTDSGFGVDSMTL